MYWEEETRWKWGILKGVFVEVIACVVKFRAMRVHNSPNKPDIQTRVHEPNGQFSTRPAYDWGIQELSTLEECKAWEKIWKQNRLAMDSIYQGEIETALHVLRDCQ